ncbi:hypothetical protein GCM10022239_22670 [Leifsonia bigeumensis]|uniref:NERD domain-containing protein n=2 Tax=Leifsonella bigeumensis TaxID=433643 RepID=A0ABP7FT17_9MICO
MEKTDAVEPDRLICERTYPMVRELLRQHAAVVRLSHLARFFGLHPLPRGLRSLYQAAVGEVAVADALAQLGPEWLVLHAVPVGKDGSDVDHIAIGPPGVYTISVRHHPGRELWVGGGVLLVDGERMPHIRDCEFEAVRAAQLMSDAVGERVEATPCLVVVDPRSVTVARPPRRVAILTPRELRPWLKSLSALFGPDRLARFRAAASEDDTWHDIGKPTADVAECLDRFRRLQAEVSQARHLRLTWITGGLVLLWLVAIIGIGGFTTGLLFR